MISSSLDNQVNQVEYFPCVFSDHSFVKLVIKISPVKHGKGVWKMNLNTIKSNLFQNTFKIWWEQWKKEQNNYQNIKIWWDITKKKIKELTIWCSHKLKEDNNTELSSLESELQVLESKPESSFTEITRLKQQISQMQESINHGIKVRSRIKWFEQGEQSTKYFHNLEKRNAKNKLWESIYDKDGQLIDGTQNVLKRH